MPEVRGHDGPGVTVDPCGRKNIRSAAVSSGRGKSLELGLGQGKKRGFGRGKETDRSEEKYAGNRPWEERRAANMPRGDRTGLMGMGPLTGRGAGFCAGPRSPGFGRFFRRGSGRGPGFGGGGGGRGHVLYLTGTAPGVRGGGGGQA